MLYVMRSGFKPRSYKSSKRSTALSNCPPLAQAEIMALKVTMSGSRPRSCKSSKSSNALSTSPRLLHATMAAL